MEIYDAYRKAFTNVAYTRLMTERITYEINLLLSDPEIRKGMALALQPLKDALEKQIKRNIKRRSGNTRRLCCEKYYGYDGYEKPDTQFHKSNIEFLVKLGDNSLDLTEPKQLGKEQKRLKEAEDAKFSEISPLDKRSTGD